MENDQLDAKLESAANLSRNGGTAWVTKLADGQYQVSRSISVNNGVVIAAYENGKAIRLAHAE